MKQIRVVIVCDEGFVADSLREFASSYEDNFGDFHEVEHGSGFLEFVEVPDPGPRTQKYTFRFHRQEWTDITVEAASEEEAADLASDKYNNGEYEDDVEAFENLDMENITKEEMQ